MVENALTIGIIKMALPDPNYVASVPLQYVFLDKDTGASLAAGIVSFFSDPEFTIPKDVYQLTNNPDNTISFTNLGNVLVLSAIGTFVDGSGENLVPYYYPWTNPPGDPNGTGDEQLYFVKVESSGLILQFTLTEWPPNSLSGSGEVVFQTSLTQNLLTNPGFSVVSFLPTPGGITYVYTVTSSSSFPVAPGWSIDAIGNGTITVQQLSLSSSIPSNAPYALSIGWSTGFTELRLNQRLTNSPRIIQGDAVSGSIVASSLSPVSVTLLYIPSNALGSPTQLTNGATALGMVYTTIAGTSLVNSINTDSASGYVIFSIEIDSLTTGNTINITSAQMVEVGSITTIADYIEQTTQEELNGLMWYYEPQLSYKPIPSYTIGWDFAFNPAQIMGQMGGSFSTGVNTGNYILDQTILYQSVNSSLSFTQSSQFGLIVAASVPSASALIQYLDAATAVELLTGRMAVKFKGSIGPDITSLEAQINLYWTQNTSPVYPVLSSTMLTAVSSTGTPTPLAGWTAVPRVLGPAAFLLIQETQSFNFNGWDATQVTGIGTATGFAIVVSFGTLASTPTNQQIEINYCTLCRGDIATSPSPMTLSQTLQALQYYFESTYSYTIAPGTASADSPLVVPQNRATSSTPALYAQSFGIQYQTEKRSSTPVITFYSPNSGTIANVYGVGFTSSTLNFAGDIPINGGSTAKWATNNFLGSKAATYEAEFASAALSGGSGAGLTSSAYITFHCTIDARFGVVA